MKKSIAMKFLFLLISFTLVFTLLGCSSTEEELNCTDNQIEENGVCVDKELELDPDTTAPTITGVHNLNYTIGDNVPDYLDGITATDDIDGVITNDIQVDSSAVDLSTVGVYTVTLTVTDSSSNESTETLTITVTPVPIDHEELCNQDIESIEIPEEIGVVDTMTTISLPKFGSNGSFYTWSTSHPVIITPGGFVQNPPVGSPSVDVTLTVTCMNSTYSKEEDFVITVAPYQEVSVTSSTKIPFKNRTDQYTAVDVDEVEIFFVDNGSVPYMDIQTYINMMDGVLYSDALHITPIGDDKLEISYNPLLKNFYLFYPTPGTAPFDEEFTALFDFTANTVTFSSYMFFSKLSTMRNPVESLGIEVTSVDLLNVGDEFVLPLGDYNFDILIHNDGTKDNYVVPYHVLDLLFTTTVFYNNYYTPESIIGEAVSRDFDKVQLITSAKNGESIPYDIRTSSYNLLMLSLDYFSTYKEEKEIDSFKEHYALSAQTIIGSDNSSYYTKLGNFVRQLDNLKVVPFMQGYYHGDPESNLYITASKGPIVRGYEENYATYLDALIEKYGPIADLDDLPDVRYLDDNKTAIFYFFIFDRDMSDTFKARLDALPANIENVVIDLTLNTGGSVGAMFRMFGYMTDQPLMLHMGNLRNNAKISYTIENSLETYDYNWYISTSNVSTNSANAFAATAKAHGVATIIGIQAFGSSSIYDFVSLPCGFAYTIPAYNTFYAKVEDDQGGYTFESLEHGVAPDYIIESLLDDQEIIDVINEHQGNN